MRPEEEGFQGVLSSLDGAFAVVSHCEALEVAEGFGGEASSFAWREVARAVATSFAGVASAHAVGGVVSFFSCHFLRL